VGTLDRKVAVIMGATSGIGAATARRFVAEGAEVFMAGRQWSVRSLDVAVLCDALRGHVSGAAAAIRHGVPLMVEKGASSIIAQVLGGMAGFPDRLGMQPDATAGQP
jgi:hypothetical protein